MANNAWRGEAVKNFIWLCNPFFSLVAFFQSGDQKENDHRRLKIIETRLEFEYKTHSKPEHIEIIEKIQSYFRENFQDQLEEAVFPPSLNFFDFTDDKLPVLTVTYLFSFFIACDKDLRTKFYDSYKGKKIPAITQWLLNSIRTGAINENAYVSDVQFDTSYSSLIGIYLSEMNNWFFEFCYSFFLNEWFKQLEIHCSNNKLFFSHFVELNKTPLEYEKQLTLTSFNQINPNYLTHSNLENLPSKNKYVFVNKAINAHLVEENYYEKHKVSINDDESRLLGGEKDPKKWIFSKESDSYESPLMGELLDFIIHCHPNDF